MEFSFHLNICDGSVLINGDSYYMKWVMTKKLHDERHERHEVRHDRHEVGSKQLKGRNNLN